MKKLTGLIIAALLLNVGAAFGGGHLSNPNFHPKKVLVVPASIKDVHVVLFILDGTPKDFLYNLIQDGSLPTLKKYFWDDGARASTAITTFPSASAPAYQSFITGLFAGHSGIPYLQWYDRDAYKSIDYLGLDYVRVNGDMWNLKSIQDPEAAPDAPVTVFEKLQGHPTATVYSEISRGASKKYPGIPFAAIGDAFVFHHEENLDVLALNKVLKIFNRHKEKIPRFTLVGLYSADVIQHKQGAATEDAKYVLMQFDSFLEKFINLLKNRGLFENTYMVVAADHGMHNVEREIEIEPALKKAGFHIKKTNLKREKADVFISERGVSSAHLYFTKYKEVKNRVVELLRNHIDIDLVAARDDGNQVDVFSKECHSTITRIDFGGATYYGYKPVDCDPLAYCGDKKMSEMCTGRLYSQASWLAATWNKSYPDGVVQLGQIFDDGRAGDIFLSSDHGGFYRSKVATHGSLLAEDMHVPLLIRGAGVKNGEFGPIRAVDLYPMMLDWFGLPPDVNNDSVRLVDKNSLVLANLESFMAGRVQLYQSPNQEIVKNEFDAFVKERALSTANLADDLNNELGRRSRMLKKFKMLFEGAKKGDLMRPLLKSQIKKTQGSIWRLQDVKTLLTNELK